MKIHKRVVGVLDPGGVVQLVLVVVHRIRWQVFERQRRVGRLPADREAVRGDCVEVDVQVLHREHSLVAILFVRSIEAVLLLIAPKIIVNTFARLASETYEQMLVICLKKKPENTYPGTSSSVGSEHFHNSTRRRHRHNWTRHRKFA